MKLRKKTLLYAVLMMLSSLNCLNVCSKTWTLRECIDYAMENNITLRRSGLNMQSSKESYYASKAALLPSLNFSTSHNVAYQPWKSSGTMAVQNGIVEQGVSTTSYNGSYNLGASYTLWDGGRNRSTILQNENLYRRAEQDSLSTAMNIEEQIAQLFIQILYTKEAINVNKATLEAAKTNEQRAIDMEKAGSISKAECSQFTAERAQDEYNVVQAMSQERNFKRQLKTLLQITNDEDFDVAAPQATDDMALQPIPARQGVYEKALSNRPEIKSAELEAEAAVIQQRIARAGRMPTISLQGSVGTNTSSLSNNAWGTQMKTNLSAAAGLTVSVPILDQRSTRTAINKADLARQDALLNIRDKQTTLYSTIENYWIQASNNQAQFRAAKVSTEAAKESYNLLSEQFAVGLKNITELQEGKTRLLSAQQNELQSKYMTILYIKLLELYNK